MLIVQKKKNKLGIEVSGDFWDFDRLYFAIMKFTGFHGIDTNCPFPGYEDVCENLLGLCYELRHAWEGRRELEEVYNGIHEEWFIEKKQVKLSENSVQDVLCPDSNVDLDFFDKDTDEDCYDENENEELYKEGNDDQDDEYSCESGFLKSDFPNTKETNTYLKFTLTLPEAVYYALIIIELLDKTELFMQSRYEMIEKNQGLRELNKEYYFFKAEEDIARITLYSKQTLNSLYNYLGEKRHFSIISKLKNQREFFLNCDLVKINEILSSYAEVGVENEDSVFDALMGMLQV